MNKIIKLSSFCCLTVLGVLNFAHQATAQIIDNRLGKAFKEEMYFNQEFLWQNKIISITYSTSIKRPNRPIEPRPDLMVYRFNEVGLLGQIDKVSSVLSLVDSLTVEFKRNDVGEIELRTENNSKGYRTTKFNYDESGKLIRLDFGSSENISESKGTLEPGNTVNVNSETYTYSEAGTGAQRKSNYNNYGLLYSNQIITRNELGYVVSDVEELVMSNKTVTRNYHYNDKGWVSEICTTDNIGTKPKTEKFYYDEVGNLLKVEYYEDTNLLREIEVLYTDTMLIEATLDHDLMSHDIIIRKYAYQNKS